MESGIVDLPLPGAGRPVESARPRRAAPAPARVGFIGNPRSRHNAGGGLDAALAGFGDLPQAQPRSADELAEALREFRRREVRVLAVSGGDGTIREILTALPQVYGDDPPDLALLPAGKTNLAARVVGVAGRRHRNVPAELTRLLDGARRRTLRRIECPVLDVAWRDAPERRIRGFLFGAAGFAAGTRLANSHVHRVGIANAAAVALSIAAMTGSVLFGRERRALMDGDAMRLQIDGGWQRAGRHFLTLATTLDSLVLNIRPFWGEGGAPLRWLDIPAPPPRLATALLPTLLGRPRPWMIEAGYASGRARAIDIELDRPFIVDGEAFEPGPRGIRLSAGGRIGFVVP